ncbi:MAG: ABC transporter permease [Glaciecola sp.]|nr:ABC transporter permease [Glaciecola sp.]
MRFILALKSLRYRHKSVALTLFAITISLLLLFAVEHTRHAAKASFTRTISGTDLIVGPRTGPINLLLYSVFKIGVPANAISMDSFAVLAANKHVKWAVPIALGDSHHGFPVVGTTADLFTYFQYGNKQPLTFRAGQPFTLDTDAVIGAEVAAHHNYTIGDTLHLHHGVGHVSFHQHDDVSFKIAGILAPTGTPIDQTVHVTLAGLTLAHDQDQRIANNPQSDNISAIYIGLQSKIGTLLMQRAVNQYKEEPLMSIIPGVILNELWQLVGFVETLLLGIAWLIVLSTSIGLATMLLTSMRERTQELAVLRSVGAPPSVIFWLIQAEALLITAVAIILSLVVLFVSLQVTNTWLAEAFGIFIDGNIFTTHTLWIALGALLATFLTACVPAISAYKQALHMTLN